MQGIGMSVSKDGKKLTVEIDLSKVIGPSKSGKTVIIATTGGNQVVPGTDVRIGINCYRPK